MDKEARYNLYKGRVWPGWWPILDKYIPQIKAIDPNAEIEVKEKLGTLRIWVGSLMDDHAPFNKIELAAEEESCTVCEYCGAPAKRRTNRRWIVTLCDRCNNASNARKGRIIEETEQKWLTAALRED